MKVVTLLVVLFIGCVLSQECLHTGTLTKSLALSATAKQLQVAALVDQFKNFDIVFEESETENVEIAAEWCGDNEQFKDLQFAFTERDGTMHIEVTQQTPTPEPTPGPTTPATPTPTPAPTTRPNTIPAQTSSSGALSARLMYTLLALTAFFVPKNRFGFAIFLVCAVVALSPINASTTATNRITIRVGVPSTVTKYCAKDSCVDRGINGPVKTWVNVLGKRFASLEAAYENTCRARVPMKVPEGWAIATETPETKLAIRFGGFNTYGIILSKGDRYESGSDFKKIDDNNLIRSDDGVAVTVCDSIILITQDFPHPETKYTVVSKPTINAENIVTFQGFDYATADNTAYSNAGSACQTRAVQLSDSWIVAPNEGASLIIRHNPFNAFGRESFGAKCIALANGVSYAQDLGECNSGAIDKVTYDGVTVYFVPNSICNANYTRILLRRPTTLITDSWQSVPSITHTYFFNGLTLATLDNANPKDDYKDAVQYCQPRFLAMPFGWRLATGEELDALLKTDAWNVWQYHCLASKDFVKNTAGVCSTLLQKSVGSVNYYQTQGCGRVLIVREHNKEANFTIGARVLLLSTYATIQQANDTGLEIALTMLNATGAAYDHINLVDSANNRLFAESTPFDFLEDKNGNPNYYAIVVADSQFSYKNERGQSVSALSVSQREQLSMYRFQYGVRLAAMNGYPNEPRYGLSLKAEELGHNVHLKFDPKFVADHAADLVGIKTTKAFNVSGVYSRIVDPVRSTANIKPVLRYTANAVVAPAATDNIAAGIITFPDGTEEFHIFVANSLTQQHSPLLANLWMNWLTRGAWIGSRRVYLVPQLDDLFMSTEQWDNKAYAARCTGDDLRESKEFMEDLNELIPGSTMNLEFAFNGANVKADPSNSGKYIDELFDAVREMRDDFFWESHTYTHLDLTCPNSDCPANGITPKSDVDFELGENIKFTNNALFQEWGGVNYTTFSKRCMVTPRITGLDNPAALQSMVEHGIICAVGDSSRKELLPENPYHMLITTAERQGYPGVHIIPRWATEIYFDSALPSTSVAQYNYRYGDDGIFPKAQGFIGKNLTLEGILDQEASRTVNRLAYFRHDAYMFHQANLVHFPLSYKGGEEKQWSMMTLWMQSVVDLYKEYLTFPIWDVKHDDLFALYLERMARDECDIDGTFTVQEGVIVSADITAAGKCKVGVTGLKCPVGAAESECKDEIYGVDTTAWFPLDKGNYQLDGNVKWL